MHELRKELLYSSIADIQDVLRAIDAKLTAILIILVLPLGSLGKITLYIKHGIFCNSLLVQCLTIVFSSTLFVSWFISLFVVFKGLSAIENPVQHISGKKCATGVFYNFGLFSIVPKYLFSIPNKVMSTVTVDEQLKMLPETNEQVVRELLFEQHKIVFIRDAKIMRQKVAFYFLRLFIYSGILLWLSAFVLRSVLC